MFYTPYTANQRIYSGNKSGNDTYISWKLITLPNGSVTYVRANDKPLYETIQSYAEETDIKLIIARCISRDGDLSALKAKKENSIDLRYFPKDIKEYESFCISVRNAFDNLPDSFKAKFSSFEEFSKNPDMLSTIFDEIVSNLKNKVEEPKLEV